MTANHFEEHISFTFTFFTFLVISYCTYLGRSIHPWQQSGETSKVPLKSLAKLPLILPSSRTNTQENISYCSRRASFIPVQHCHHEEAWGTTLNTIINVTLLFLPPFFLSWTQRSKTFSTYTKGLFLSHIVHKSIKICVSEHFSLAEKIHPPHSCDISRYRLDSINIAVKCCVYNFVQSMWSAVSALHSIATRWHTWSMMRLQNRRFRSPFINTPC